MHISQKRDDGLTFSDVAVVVWADEKSIEAAMERGVQLIVTCGVSSKEAMKACSEHRAVLELPGETAAHIFETCVEQYLSEVLSSSIEILTIPMQRNEPFFKVQKGVRMITVYYNGKPYQYADSTKYLELARTLQPQFEHDIVLASVNGKLQELWKYIKDGQV